MNLNAVGIVYRKEFTEWVRDRRTLISTVLVPLFLFPLMMVGFSALAVVMVGKAEKETPKIMILGGEDSPQLIASIKNLDCLAAKNLPASVLSPFAIKQENVAPPEKVSGATFGSFIGYTVIILCMTGAMYPAIDLTAGEKERGTMETILSSPISRLDLVCGKFLLVFSASLATAILSVISMGGSFAILGHTNLMNSSSGGQTLALNLGLLSVFLMALPLAFLFSAVLMTIALFAKSYKEAQSYLTPMTFLIVIPAVASVMPGVELTPKLALIPILNTSLVCKEIIAGTYHWNSIALIFVSTCVYAGGALFLAFKTFQRESVLFRS